MAIFSLNFDSLQALNTARKPSKTLASIPLLQDALVWSYHDVHLINNN
jgi:hypothetical protein